MKSFPLDLTPIGLIGRAHGLKGELNARLDVDLRDIIEENQLEDIFLFFEIDALPVPFLLKDFRTKGEDIYLLHFFDIKSKEEADLYTNSPILIKTELIPPDTQLSPTHFIGFTILDESENFIGKVIDFDDATINLLFLIEQNNGEQITIPVADDLIEYIDQKERIISLHIPKGLIEN